MIHSTLPRYLHMRASVHGALEQRQIITKIAVFKTLYAYNKTPLHNYIRAFIQFRKLTFLLLHCIQYSYLSIYFAFGLICYFNKNNSSFPLFVNLSNSKWFVCFPTFLFYNLYCFLCVSSYFLYCLDCFITVSIYTSSTATSTVFVLIVLCSFPSCPFRFYSLFVLHCNTCNF